MSRAMSEATEAPSSRAAELIEEAAMGRDDVGDVRGIGRRVPHIPLERAAKQDAVGSREHVAPPSRRGIKDFGLRLQHCKLAANGPKLEVTEQVPRTYARAVEDQSLRQQRELGRGGELSKLDFAACAQDVGGQIQLRKFRSEEHTSELQ